MPGVFVFLCVVCGCGGMTIGRGVWGGGDVCAWTEIGGGEMMHAFWMWSLACVHIYVLASIIHPCLTALPPIIHNHDSIPFPPPCCFAHAGMPRTESMESFLSVASADDDEGGSTTGGGGGR
jgi:hypothetical protein